MTFYDTKLSDITLTNFKAAANKARAAGDQVTDYQRVGGCARIYVSVGRETLRRNSKYAKALQSAGFKVFSRPMRSGVFIYVGYDNATGYEYAKGQAIAQAFRGEGIPAGCDADED